MKVISEWRGVHFCVCVVRLLAWLLASLAIWRPLLEVDVSADDAKPRALIAALVGPLFRLQLTRNHDGLALCQILRELVPLEELAVDEIGALVFAKTAVNGDAER